MQATQQKDAFNDFQVIYSYSRAQAIEDGVLVDVSSMAREAGIKFPVAMTDTVWRKYVEVPTAAEGSTAVDGTPIAGQDEQGRLWDIVWMLRAAARRGGSVITFSLHVRNDNRRAKLVNLKAICGPGDDMEPVITIMLPEED